MQQVKRRNGLKVALMLMTGLLSGSAFSSSAFAQSAIVDTEKPFTTVTLAQFDRPWAMTFLPNGTLLVTEKPGKLKLFDPSISKIISVSNVPVADVGGQGGLGDVIPHPDFVKNQRI